MKLSEMKELLAREGIRLTKSLGQNFLHDRNQLQRITDAAELKAKDKVLEIGPGLGPLTDLLLSNSAEVLAIEKDLRLVEILRVRFGSRLQLIHADALDYLTDEARDWRDWKLVSNLPYSVASPILVELAQTAKPPERMVATLQIEVAKRLMANVGDEDYGLLTLLAQLAFQPCYWFKIPRTCFFPEPDVDSACVTLIRRRTALLPHHLQPTFVRVVRRAFSQRRKQMLKLLKQEWPAEALAAAFQETAIAPAARGETVSLEQFAALTCLLCNAG
jgi:16S rRNA (adenine1518-N6/adenine1519-N6)-dimethyltransferase